MIAGSSITCRGHSLFIIVPRLFFCFIEFPFSLKKGAKPFGSSSVVRTITPFYASLP